MNTKRDFLLWAASSIALSSMGQNAWGQTEDPLITDPYLDFDGDVPRIDLRTYDPRVDEPKGTKPAMIEEELIAKDIILKVPKNGNHIEVAEYFRGLTAVNQSNEPYNAGWKERWNPVIRQFFVATDTKPAGDVTPWCAAFVNFVLMESGLHRTENAAALSFRTTGSTTTDPRPGDIAVFIDKRSHGHGHVGFYLKRDKRKGILVLGGNQSQSSRHHVISQQWLVEDSKRLKLDSFRDQRSFEKI